MGPLLNDWILARMMSAQKKDDSIIYRLQNYVCDGTVNTAINTGIYLFDTTLYPNGFHLYLDITMNDGNVVNGSFVRCRNSTSPYNGLSIRCHFDSHNKPVFNLQLNSSSYNLSSTIVRTVVEIIKTTSDGKIVLFADGVQRITANIAAVNSPLVIGGELPNDITQQWNPSRFGKCTIHSLLITKL